jgi:hypothetical protein
MNQRIKDILLELKIRRLNRKLIAAEPENMLDVWEALVDAIKSRSGDQIKRMEAGWK